MATLSSIPTSSSNTSTNAPAVERSFRLGRAAMEGQERSFAAARHARFHAAVPLRESGAAAGAAMAGVVRRPLEPGLEGHGAFREAGGDAGTAAARHRTNRPCLRARLCRFPFRRLRLAQGLSKARCVPPKDAGAAVGKDFGAAAGIKPV